MTAPAAPASAVPSPSAPPLLELSGIAAGYGRVEVVRDVSLVLPPGSIVALLGPNGAGKSTVVKVASGRLRPSRGTVRVMGRDAGGDAAHALARGGVCALPEGRGVFPNLTVAENLRMWTFRPGVSRGDVETIVYDRFPRLRERRRQLAGRLSGGEQQMLALSRALVTRPRVLLLDEMSMGLAPVVVAELFELVAGLRQEGVAVLLVEQFADAALGLADHAVVLAHGSVAAAGPPDEVRAHLHASYLGGSSAAGPDGRESR